MRESVGEQLIWHVAAAFATSLQALMLVGMMLNSTWACDQYIGGLTRNSLEQNGRYGIDMLVAFDINLCACNNASTPSHGSLDYGWIGRGERCMHGNMVWGGWAGVGDATMATWFGVDRQRWEMHA